MMKIEKAMEDLAQDVKAVGKDTKAALADGLQQTLEAISNSRR